MTQARTVSEILEARVTAKAEACEHHLSNEFTWLKHRHDYNGQPHMSDGYVASEVRMLMRSQLNHEAVCTTAGSRIAKLAIENAALREEIERKDVELTRLRMERDHLQEAIVKYGRKQAMGFAEPAHLQLAIDNAFQAHAKRTLKGDEDNG